MNTTNDIGFEQVARAAFLTLLQNLNTAIYAQTSVWAQADVSFYSALSRGYDPIILEEIPKEKFYFGFTPSLLNGSIDSFPNISVYPIRAVSVQPLLDYDQPNVDEKDISFAVETLLRSTVNEDEVTKRMTRTSNAIHAVLMGNATLGGIVDNLNFVSVLPADVEIVKKGISSGEDWFWQGSRLEYRVRKASIY